MVVVKLPYPILKYLELSPEKVDEILHEYPFYLFPKVASILDRQKLGGEDLKEMNFFGFNEKKLNKYSEIYSKIDVLTISEDIESDSNSGFIEDIDIEFNELSVQDETYSENKPIEIDLIGDQQNELLENENLEIEFDTPLNSRDMILEIPELSDHIDFSNSSENISIEFSSDKKLLDVNTDENDYEENSKNEIEQNIESSIDNNSAEEVIEEEIEETIQEIETSIQEAEEPEIEESKEIPVSIDQKTEGQVQDFSSWLNTFVSNTAPILKKDNAKLNKTEDSKSVLDEFKLNTELHKIERNLLNSLEDKEASTKVNSSSISRDNELEGVMRDNFFKAQLENKRSSRKTPTELRIQDEALLSLAPFEIATETMAILHVQQGNIPKAIEIYEKLIEQIPEKSSFFASQIEKLRK